MFKNAEQLTDEGFYKVHGGAWMRGQDLFVPLYEGKMVQAFEHRAASVIIATKNLFRPGQSAVTDSEQYADPTFVPEPRHFVPDPLDIWPPDLRWCIAFKDITSVTNTRTMIAALVPYCGAGHTLPVLFPPTAESIEGAVVAYRHYAPFLCANLNSFVYDFCARQKVHNNHLAWYVVEQLPVVPEDWFHQRIGRRPIDDMVHEEVVALTYTAHDMTAFARDQGYEGPPFEWDEEDRLRRRARLDALFFYCTAWIQTRPPTCSTSFQSFDARRNKRLAAIVPRI
jgi:hypothetical protein